MTLNIFKCSCMSNTTLFSSAFKKQIFVWKYIAEVICNHFKIADHNIINSRVCDKQLQLLCFKDTIFKF